MALIDSLKFLTNILPSFAYGLGKKHTLDLVLGYSSIDLRGTLIMRKGSHNIVIENNGTVGGKPVIVISKD